MFGDKNKVALAVELNIFYLLLPQPVLCYVVAQKVPQYSMHSIVNTFVVCFDPFIMETCPYESYIYIIKWGKSGVGIKYIF